MANESRVSPHPDAVLRRVGSGAVLVHLASGHVYELNDTAARAWELAAEGRSASEITTTLELEYNAASGTIETDVEELFSFLSGHGLLSP
ncbi:MAG TPA: PqqD family protein [Vicinamibacterales bacterium]|nr:PqqD family protein [Vicinamibacterales bacterium]